MGYIGVTVSPRGYVSPDFHSQSPHPHLFFQGDAAKSVTQFEGNGHCVGDGGLGTGESGGGQSKRWES